VILLTAPFLTLNLPTYLHDHDKISEEVSTLKA